MHYICILTTIPKAPSTYFETCIVISVFMGSFFHSEMVVEAQ